MIDVNTFAYSLGINPGWIGVVLGILLFLMGRYYGKQIGVVDGANGMITMLEDNGFLKVKSRRTDEDGNEVTEYSKVDEVVATFDNIEEAQKYMAEIKATNPKAAKHHELLISEITTKTEWRWADSGIEQGL